MLRRWLLLFGGAGLLVAALPALGWWYMTRPQVHLSATSPDGTWSATVIRQQTSLVGLTDVILQVHDQTGSLLWQQRMDERDLWQDVEVRYQKIRIDNERVWIGSDANDGTGFEVQKADAFAGREVPCALNQLQFAQPGAK